MANDFSRIRETIRVVDQLKKLVKDDDAFSQLTVDLDDLVESGEWLLSNLLEMGAKSLTDDEIETFLINLDVRFAEHVIHHATSLRKGIADILEDIARRSPD